MKNQKEHGSLMDMCFPMIVMLFMFMLLLGYLSYSTGIRQKMIIDVAVKNTLSQMEETGAWTSEIETNFINELQRNGVTAEITANGSTGAGGSGKADYGSDANLDITIQFPNPMWKYKFMRTFSPQEKITYHILRSTTAKW